MTATPIMSILKVRTFDQRELDLTEAVEQQEDRTKQTQMVPWSECLPLIDKIEAITGWGHAQILQETGYNSESSFKKWSDAGEAAKRFQQGLYGLMFRLGMSAEPIFTHDELSLLFGLLNNWDIPTGQRRRLITKVAKEMAALDD